MELDEYLTLLRRYWRSIAATLLIVVSSTTAVSLMQSRTWTGTTSLYVSVESGTAGELSQGANYAERQVKSFVEVARSSFVLQPAIDALGIATTTEELTKSISVVAPINTSIIEISATRQHPQEAADVANGVADSLARSVAELSPRSGAGERLVQATVIERAVEPTSPTSPKPILNLAIGVLAGLALGLIQALVRARLDTKVRTAAQVQRATELSVIGTIARHDPRTEINSSGYSPTDEAFRTLRTNLRFLGLAGQRRPSLVLTSSRAAEGKTETSTRLAKSLAQVGERVLLVDADLRRPRVSERLGLDGSVGLSHVLSGQADAWDLVQRTDIQGLDVLAAGATPPNPAELLASDAMATFIQDAESRYDYVLFDSPPLLPVTDAAVIAHQTGGAILVARSGVVTRQELSDAIAALEASGSDALGVVLNDVDRASGNSSYAYFYQRYEQENSVRSGTGKVAVEQQG